MDLYQAVPAYLHSLTLFEAWPEVAALIHRFAARNPHAWKLPVLACQAVGGEQEDAVPAAAAIACCQISIILIDDMLDDDPRGEYLQIGAAAAANQAAALLSAGMAAVLQGAASPETKLATLEALTQMMLTTALGQYWDVCGVQDEPAYWRLVQTKSAPFYGTALYLGAIFGGADPGTARIIQDFGGLYGELIQIHDDINDCMATPANPDWTNGRAPLPVLFAEVVDHPAQARFLELRRAIPDPIALKEAQTILVRCGAVSYAVDQLLSRYRVAQEKLASAQIEHRELLETLLVEVVEPVRRLFAALGSEQPEKLLQISPLASCSPGGGAG